MTDWTKRLAQASWRGVPFGVTGSTFGVGRKQAVHEYPFRDKPWVEDLGRATRKVGFTAFLVENSKVYGGGDVIAQRDAMVRAAEMSGPGTLKHPTLGTLNVSLVGLNITERWDAGYYFELEFQFIESGAAIFPGNAAATGPAVATAAAKAQTAIAQSFKAAIQPLLPAGGQVFALAGSGMSLWNGQITGLASDATLLVHLASQLTGNYGRFYNGANSGAFSGPLASIFGAAVTVDSLAQAAAAARAGVFAGAASAQSLIGQINLPGADPTAIAGAVSGLIGNLVAAAADPADGLRILQTVLAYQLPTTDAASVAINGLYQQTAAVALAQVAQVYQPSSYDDANAVRGQVTASLDAQILLAGDAGNDGVFVALRALRVATVQDLTVRGATLAPLVTVTSPMPLPSLVLAQRLYRDATRADQLVTEGAPASPLFMPLTFRALAP